MSHQSIGTTKGKSLDSPWLRMIDQEEREMEEGRRVENIDDVAGHVKFRVENWTSGGRAMLGEKLARTSFWRLSARR